LRSLQAFGCASGLRGAHTASIFLHPCAARSTVSRQNNRLFEYMHAWFQQISPSGLPIADASVAFARDYFWNNMHSSLPELSLLIFWERDPSTVSILHIINMYVADGTTLEYESRLIQQSTGTSTRDLSVTPGLDSSTHGLPLHSSTAWLHGRILGSTSQDVKLEHRVLAD
jgi:hypothetical protein